MLFFATIYYTAVPENLSDDIIEQTADTLAAIDVLLQRVGSFSVFNNDEYVEFFS